MLDLYCWVSLLCELCLNESTLLESVSSFKESVNHIEKQIAKAKQQLGKLAADAKTECNAIFNCEDILQNLMVRLHLERRRMLSACVELTTEKLNLVLKEVRSETTKLSCGEVRHVALFCKKVLKAMHTQLPTELPEVDLAAFSSMKVACVQFLRLVVATVIENSTDRRKHMQSEGCLAGTKLAKVTDHVISC